MTVSVLIDAGNLRVGGGVQVGASFVDELAALVQDEVALARWPWLADVVVEVSDVVRRDLTRSTDHLDVRVVRRTWSDLARPSLRRREFDVSFTVFGPNYTPRRARRQVVGFADVSSLFPDALPPQPASAQARRAIRARLSRALFRRCDLVVAEAAFVARTLVERWGCDRDRIVVVPNVLNAVFVERSRQLPVEVPDATVPMFCYVARGYPHKNHDLLGPAGRLLRERHGREVRFALTLEAEEWNALSSETREHSVNVGPIAVAQAPALYAACVGTVFPSLAECFSVTPLEALASGSPLVASDRDFVRDVVGESAAYVDPHDPASLADALDQVLAGSEATDRRRSGGLELARGWPTARQRAEAYLDVVSSQLAPHAEPAR